MDAFLSISPVTDTAAYLAKLERTVARYMGEAANGGLDAQSNEVLMGTARSLAKRTGRTIDQVLAAHRV